MILTVRDVALIVAGFLAGADVVAFVLFWILDHRPQGKRHD